MTYRHSQLPQRESLIRFALWMSQQRRQPDYGRVMSRFEVCRATAYRWLQDWRAAIGKPEPENRPPRVSNDVVADEPVSASRHAHFVFAAWAAQMNRIPEIPEIQAFANIGYETARVWRHDLIKALPSLLGNPQ